MNNDLTALKNIAWQKNAAAAIRQNPNLSDQGKRVELARVQEQRARQMGEAAGELRERWSDIRYRYDRMLKERQKIEAAAAEKWDYHRLQFNLDRARRELANLRTLGDVEAAYNRARRSGDEHQARAWAELAGDLENRQEFDAANRAALMRRMGGDLDKLTRPPELAKIAERESVLVSEAYELAKQTDNVRRHYAPDHAAALGADPFAGVEGGARVTIRSDATDHPEAGPRIYLDFVE